MTWSAGGSAPVRGRRGGQAGMTLVELVLVIALIAVVTMVAVPLAARAVDSGRARSASGFVAGRFRLARQQAAAAGHSVGLVFDQIGGRWTFRVCSDGNGDGLRRADIASGRDACSEGPYDLGQLFPGVRVFVDPAIPGPDGDPATSDPVRFGSSDVASFSASGTCTAGTLFVRSADGQQYAVRISSVGRTRTLRYEPQTRRWSEV